MKLIETLKTIRGMVDIYKERGPFSGTSLFSAQIGALFIACRGSQIEIHRFIIDDWSRRG